MVATPCYAELCARSCFSFLRGASQPEELVERAKSLGLRALGICDRDGLYGMARAHAAATRLGQKLIVGAELTIAGSDATLILLVQDHTGYTNLCNLLTLAHADRPKGQASVSVDALSTRAAGLIAILPAPYDPAWSPKVRDMLGIEGTFVAVQRHLVTDQREQQEQAVSLATSLGLRIVATARPLYHDPSRKQVADVLCCIRNKTTLDAAGPLLSPNAEATLQPVDRMTRLFRDRPQWLHTTLEVADRCTFSMSELRYRFPSEYYLDKGESADDALDRLVRDKLPWRYPAGTPPAVLDQIARELSLIRELRAAPYFLSVLEIVEIARDKGILCQGRGSAANSAVCFVLGITAVDPARSNLLFERFMSAERKDPPDIDVDFEHERREEVIQEIYRRYGRDRAAMVSEVICYRGKSALRDVGKAFGLSLDQVDRLSGALVHSYSEIDVPDHRLREMGLDPRDDRLRHVIRIAREIHRFPRHLSIHVGGFVLSAAPLCEVAPVEPARMQGRTVIPWDKDDLDILGFFKVDILALGMLTCVRKALALVMPDLDPLTALASIPPEDVQVYEALSRADSIGVFQVESRAQMAMLPRLRPRCFYDLVIQVAIVRPGPIQGGMVHPYLARRAGRQTVTCPHPRLWPILERTLGVPLFQEQVMQIAIAGAGYTGGEADQLRRDMAAWRKHGRLMRHRTRLLNGFARTGISKSFGEQLFKQIQGFGEYGFPESHAASFALLVYSSAWLKVHHPAAFAAALINSQPMGFYSPSTIVRDAQAHGVEVLPVSVTGSGWDCTLHGDPVKPSIRLGLRLVRGIGESTGRAIERARMTAPFRDLDDLIQRAHLRKNVIEALAEAGALESLVQGRRHALWRARAPRSGPLFGDRPLQEADVPLPALRPAEQLVLDYARVGLSLHDHPMRYLRTRLDRQQVLRTAGLAKAEPGRIVAIAGVVLNRQQPVTASGVVFMTLEDETGMANIIVRSHIFDRDRHVALHAKILLVRGRLEKRDGVTHVLVDTMDRLDTPQAGGDDDRVLYEVRPQSRDFR
jgi:error-prone DNA polymerase